MSEIDERMRNWRTDRIAEYARLENEITLETHEMDTDPERNRLLKEIEKSKAELEIAEARYTHNIDAAKHQQAGIKLELADAWSNTEDKTFECTAGTATLRTTKSLNIRSKEKLIEFLTTINKLPNFIKSFEIKKLRKIMDAGLLESDIATYDETQSIAIKIAEGEQ